MHRLPTYRSPVPGVRNRPWALIMMVNHYHDLSFSVASSESCPSVHEKLRSYNQLGLFVLYMIVSWLSGFLCQMSLVLPNSSRWHFFYCSQVPAVMWAPVCVHWSSSTPPCSWIILWIERTAVLLRMPFAKAETLTPELMASSCLHFPTSHLLSVFWDGESKAGEASGLNMSCLSHIPQPQSLKALFHYCPVTRLYLQDLLIFVVMDVWCVQRR